MNNIVISSETFDYKIFENKLIKIFNNYPYTREKRPYNLDKLEKKVDDAINEVNDSLCELNYPEKCKIMDNIYRLRDDLEFKFFGCIS